jgi:hypothetical protein
MERLDRATRQRENRAYLPEVREQVQARRRLIALMPKVLIRVIGGSYDGRDFPLEAPAAPHPRRLARSCLYLFAALAGAGPSLAQRPNATEVDSAMRRGKAAKGCELVAKTASPFGQPYGFTVVLEGPLNRIECAAGDSAKRYLTFSMESAEREIHDGALMVLATPVKPIRFSNGEWKVTEPATHVVIFAGKGDDGTPPLQPDSTRKLSVEWSDMVGGKLESGGMVAWFPGDRIPLGDLTVAVINPQGEYRARFAKKDRSLVR